MQADNPTEPTAGLDAEAIMNYLQRNPEFFVHHTEILPRLQIPHESGAAVSLIERQVSVLRGKCQRLEGSLKDMITVARENELLHLRLHGLVQDIISVSDLDALAEMVLDSLRSNFNADDVRLLLLHELDAEDESEVAEGPVTRHWNSISDSDVTRYNCTGYFKKGETVCGLPEAKSLELLGRGSEIDIASMAVIPLQYQKRLGLVVLGSEDEHRFARGKGVMFLNQLGEILSRRLARLI